MAEISPETKVSIENLTKWDLYFPRIMSVGDVKIYPFGSSANQLTYAEIEAQVQSDNSMFTGSDGIGSHARIHIVDDDIREALFGQRVDVALLTPNAVKKLLGIRNKPAFTKRLNELVVTDAEKKMIIEFAKLVACDDAEAWKVEAIEKLSGYKMRFSK